MKRILFVVPYYEVGGTMTSLRNLLPLIDRSRYSIDVFAITNTGDEYRSLMPYAEIIGMNAVKATAASSAKGGLKASVIRFLKSIKRTMTKLGMDPSEAVFTKMAKPLSDRHYDIVIAYQEGQATLMASHIEAPLKIAWVHSIYSRFKTLASPSYEAVYTHYDKIVCVSNSAAEDMKRTSPELAPKINVVYNALDVEAIRKASLEKTDMKDMLNIVSVGRLDPVKRFSHIPQIASVLKQKGLEFCWTIIGGTAKEEEKDLLLGNIKKYDVSEEVVWVGQKSNPYPYVANADILVCLSSSETFNYTLAEAIALGTPVLTSDFPCAKEFVENGVAGLIGTLDEMPELIYKILTDKSLYETIKVGLANTGSKNALVAEQFTKVSE